MMRKLNYIVLCLFGFMIGICGVCTVMTSLYMQDENVKEANIYGVGHLQL